MYVFFTTIDINNTIFLSHLQPLMETCTNFPLDDRRCKSWHSKFNHVTIIHCTWVLFKILKVWMCPICRYSGTAVYGALRILLSISCDCICVWLVLLFAFFFYFLHIGLMFILHYIEKMCFFFGTEIWKHIDFTNI